MTCFTPENLRRSTSGIGCDFALLRIDGEEQSYDAIPKVIFLWSN
jgi:hypothetical protein